MMSAIFFGFFAGLTVFSALAVAYQKNLVYASFCLLITFLGISALYILLEADFLAVTQILIYVGGILVLFLFGILITQKKEKGYLISGIANKKRSAFAVITLAAILIYTLWKDKALFSNEKIVISSVQTLGMGLMQDYLIPFEIAGVLLLVILIGVLTLTSSIKQE